MTPLPHDRRDPWDLLADARTVLAVHAHPDDESLATGALLAELSARGVRVVLVTATRGEEGEIVPGSVPAQSTRALEEIRAGEIDAAARTLGIAERHMLGEPPALALDAAARRYRDSGMTWVREGLAGPSPDAGPDSFSLRPMNEAAADLAALIDAVRPEAVIGYDDAGTYGHPDHVRAHHVSAAASARAGVPMLEVASAQDAEGFSWREQPGSLEAVAAALACYRTQLTVLGTRPAVAGAAGADAVPAVRVRHVGGQDEVIAMRTGLRLSGSAR